MCEWPEVGDERIYFDEERCRLVKERFEHPHGWLYKGCLTINNEDVVSEFVDGFEVTDDADSGQDLRESILSEISEGEGHTVLELSKRTGATKRDVQDALEVLMERGEITSTPDWEYRRSRRIESDLEESIDEPIDGEVAEGEDVDEAFRS